LVVLKAARSQFNNNDDPRRNLAFAIPLMLTRKIEHLSNLRACAAATAAGLLITNRASVPSGLPKDTCILSNRRFLLCCHLGHFALDRPVRL